ncbi:thiamine pyrophosphate-binding protein [Hyphomicrobium sulfonivorans]|uniref:thiamine pyrophosphate-binding protein n=1 Tax=Hyphomicrobium sulfonivorans TaxID=121290 RepID=UPI00157152A0|nr:thiamine pyrophosphate-binding protein [Hyphomicrobium sulfonivorans]MBI1650680.1 thiamine pyrophosphate-binding protein [Hyphomicrobium sulfonivorans]NSL71962.1 thiamine pyrophosphate-binding protein [Hyphomicrobium sulfonivorans]
MRTGGKILVDQLVLEGCRAVYTVPGESFLAALDAMFDVGTIRAIVCRHEGGAAMMAEAAGKLTGNPGVAFVTRAPGATNASSGVYVAHHDATPMVLLVGLIERGHEGRGAFQEIDLKAMFGGIANWVGIAREPERIAEMLATAFNAARSGRPGPAVLGLPEDILTAVVEAEDAGLPPSRLPAPSAADMTKLKAKLSDAERPLVLLGGAGWNEAAAANIEKFAETFEIPVASAFRRQDHMDNRHPCYVGHAGIDMDAKLMAALRGSDLLLVIGEGLSEITTGAYTHVKTPRPNQYLVHAHPSPEAIGRVFRADLPIISAAEPFTRALARMKPPTKRRWNRLRKDLRASYERSLKPLATTGTVRMEEVVASISRELPDDAIITNGAGNYASFVHRYFQYKQWPSQLAPTSGSMGYGLPAAIAAKIEFPDRPVIAFAGDGCLLMTGQELATAVQYGLPIIIIVANNGMYGTIRMHQERRYPGRVVGTTLVNPDFVAFARSFGAHGERVDMTEAFLPAFRRALEASGPVLIELRLDPEAISVKQTLSQIRGDKD